MDNLNEFTKRIQDRAHALAEHIIELSESEAAMCATLAHADLTTEEGRLQAIRLQASINAMQIVVANIIAIVETEEKKDERDTSKAE